MTMKLAMPKASILAVDWAPPGSEWEKRILLMWEKHIIPVLRLYPQPDAYLADNAPADLFFLDSSAGYYADGGHGHHLRLQCLFLGLALCRKNAVVILHDAKRKAQEMQAVLRGISSPMDSYGQMEAVRLHLDWDAVTGERQEVKKAERAIIAARAARQKEKQRCASATVPNQS